MKVENASVPSLKNFATKAVLQILVQLVIKAPGVVGKSAAPMVPVTYADPVLSIAIAAALSNPLLPRYVEYRIALPAGFSLVTNTLVVPWFVDWNALSTG